MVKIDHLRTCMVLAAVVVIVVLAGNVPASTQSAQQTDPTVSGKLKE
jgi:hypothetical protein